MARLLIRTLLIPALVMISFPIGPPSDQGGPYRPGQSELSRSQAILTQTFSPTGIKLRRSTDHWRTALSGLHPTRLVLTVKADGWPVRPAPPQKPQPQFQPVAAVWTFDDCEDGDHHQIRVDRKHEADQYIAVLNSHNVPKDQAIFFLTGECYNNYPDIVQDIHQSGYPIGNHTYSHENLNALSYAAAQRQILGGPHETQYLRYPYGNHYPLLDRWAERQGFEWNIGSRYVGWDSSGGDSGPDGLARSCSRILEDLVNTIQPQPTGKRPVVLLHLYNPNSPAAMNAYLDGQRTC